MTDITFFEPKLREYLKQAYDRKPLTNTVANIGAMQFEKEGGKIRVHFEQKAPNGKESYLFSMTFKEQSKEIIATMAYKDNYFFDLVFYDYK